MKKPVTVERVMVKSGTGRVPAVVLIDPKYGHNASAALRACAAFSVTQLWVTGNRAVQEWESRRRLPREERMKAYDKVEVGFCDYPFDAYKPGSVTPVAVEVLENAEPLTTFVHPENALYVFGPEDGSIPKAVRLLCHRRVIIPSDHCLNLSVAVGSVLLHRRMSRQLAGLEPVRASYDTLDEARGFIDSDEGLTA